MKKMLLSLCIILISYHGICSAQSAAKNSNAKIVANTIATSTISPFNYCKGAAVSVPFTIGGTFNSDNVFTAQLSDPGGNFSSPTTIGTLAGLAAGTINATIPPTASQGGAYRIRVIGSSPTTIGTDNGTNLSVNPLPTAYSVTGNSSYCAGGNGVVIGISNSETGVNYQLQRDGTNVGTALSGNFLPLTFGLQTIVGTYSVIGTFTATGCSQAMDNSITLTINPLPLLYSVTGGGSFCADGIGVPVGLSNSQVGVNYQLLRYAVEVGVPVGGTGDQISFGNQTSAGTYTVIAKNASTGCTQNMSGSVIVTTNPLPTQYAVVGGGSYCEGDNGVPVILYSSDTGVVYQLKVDGANTGTPKNGTGLALEFGLQKQTGTYTVEAVNIRTNCKSSMTSSKTVERNPIPPKPTITKVGNDLSSSENIGNQWYLNKQIIVGATSKTYSPTANGSYSVVVTQKGCPSPMSDLVDVTINSDKLTAAFNADVTTGVAPLVVNFTDASTGKPTSWKWDFGDTQTSTAQKPTHTYTKSGSYTVTLTVSDGTTNDTKIKNAYIVVQESSSVIPDFKAASTSGILPFLVQFTDLSAGAPTAWEWDFGDGSSVSTLQNPEHTYSTFGNYTVTLNVTKDSKKFTATKKDFIHVDSVNTAVDEDYTNNNQSENRISLTPNPTDGKNMIHYYSPALQKVVLSITSILGEQIVRKELEMERGENIIPLGNDNSEFANGTYYVVVQHSTGILSRILHVLR